MVWYSRNIMNAISIDYTDLSSAAMIKIWQIADLLGVTPAKATEIYLTARAKEENRQHAA